MPHQALAFWSQIAPHFQDSSDHVLFEILNEPNKALNPVWNDTLAGALAVIRKTNPARNVVIGPSFWNSLDRLPELSFPIATATSS